MGATMPASLFHRIDLDCLYSPFLEKLLDVVADCRAAGQEYTATLGFRTYAEQDSLFAQGRTTPGKIVTNAKGGESAHNFGLAVDFYAGSWDPPKYWLLGKMANARGLVWGGDWTHPDRPHVQFPGYVTAAELAPLKHCFESAPGQSLNSLRAVWALLESK